MLNAHSTHRKANNSESSLSGLVETGAVMVACTVWASVGVNSYPSGDFNPHSYTGRKSPYH